MVLVVGLFLVLPTATVAHAGSSVASRPDPTAALAPGLPGLSPSSAPALSSIPAPFGHAIQGPIHGHYYDVTDRITEGVGPANFVAVDPESGVVFAASRYGGEVTAFGEANETLFRFVNLNPNGLIETFDLDTLHHLIWIGVQPEKAYYGYTGDSFVWGLDENTFALRVTIPLFPGSAHPFGPSRGLFVPESGKLYLQNGSGAVAVLNTSTDLVAPVIPVPFPGSYGTGLSFYSNGSNSFVIAGVGQGGWFSISLTNDTMIGSYPFSSSVYLGEPAADPPNGYVWFRNASADGLVKFYPNGSFGGSYPLNTSTYGLTVFPSLNTMVFSSSVGAVGDVVISMNALNLQVVGWRPTGSQPSEYAFDSATASVVTGGYDNGSLLNLQLYNLTVLHRYPAFPSFRGSTAVDPARGRYFVGELDPASITGYNESNGSAVWRTAGGWVANATGWSQDIDPRAGVLYSTSQGSRLQLLEFSEDNGSFLRNLSLAQHEYSSGLWIDPEHRILYASYVGFGNPGVIVYDLTGAAVLRNITLPSWFDVCGGNVNPATTSLYLQSCGAQDNVSELSGTNFTRFALHDLPSGRNYPNYVSHDIAVNASGYGFVPTSGGRTANLSILAPGRPAQDRLLALPNGLNANSVAVDDPAGLLYVDSSPFEGADPIGVYDESTLAPLGNLTQPIATTNLAVDPLTSTVISPLVWSSQIVTLRAIPVPASPTLLNLTPGNDSLTARWAPSPVAEGFAIDGYDVSVSSDAGQTWAVAARPVGPSVRLDGLVDGTSYLVRVAAFGVGGTSPWSAVATATPVGVPYPPTGLTLAPSGSTGISVSWSPPTVTGGLPILNYTVQYRAGTGAWTEVSAGPASRASLTGLEAGTAYTVRVVAWNRAGNSSPSAEAQLVPGETASGLFGVPVPYVLVLLLLVIAAIVAALVLFRRRRAPPAPSVPPATPPPGALGPAPPSPPAPGT